MEVDEIIDNLKKYKRQAKQLFANSNVVPFERAEAAIRKAYKEGVDYGKRNMEGNTEF